MEANKKNTETEPAVSPADTHDKVVDNDHFIDARGKVMPKGYKERLYDKIPLTLKQLDIIIYVLAGMFALFIIYMILKGTGVL